MHIYLGKNHLNFNSVWSEIMSLKSDQLELGFSIDLRCTSEGLIPQNIRELAKAVPIVIEGEEHNHFV